MACNQGSIVPDNIKKYFLATHVFDNIYCSNKCRRFEIQLTSSIIVQKNDIVDQLVTVELEPNYEFSKVKSISREGK